MKLKCRINGKDYDLVQGCTFTENFNETLDSAVICIDQIPEIVDLKPYDDVYIWNADEEFDGYYCAGDFIFVNCVLEKEIINYGTNWAEFKPHNYDTPYTDKPNSFYELNEETGVGTLSGAFWDVWFERFLCQNQEEADKMKIRPGRGYFNSPMLMGLTIKNSQGQTLSNRFLVLQVDKPFYDGTNVISIVTDNTVQGYIQLRQDIVCSYDIEKKTISFNSIQNGTTYLFETFTIVNIYPYYDNYVAYKNGYEQEISIELENDNFTEIDDIDIEVKYLNNWLKTTSQITIVDEETIILSIDVKPVPSSSSHYSIDIQLNREVENGKVKYKGSYSSTLVYVDNQNPSFWDLVDDIRINKISVIAQDHSSLPTFFKHMLVDDFTRTRLQLNDSYTNKDALFKYEINLFSEIKRLEKLPLPNISVTQSIVVEEKRSCWFYLEKFVDLYSPKYKKSINLGRKIWQYVSKYYVSRNNNSYLESLNPHIVTNLYEVFKDVICPEFSLTNPSLKDVISQIMITKDLIPIVFNDVIYGLNIGATEYNKFNRNGTNFDVASMSSENYATDARREYGNALSQESSAHLIEYLGFRNPNGTFLTLEDMVLETRFPIYKINSIKLCYYKRFSLYNELTHETIDNKAFLCKYDITPLVLQNVVRNTLSTNWETFEDGLGNIDYSNITSLPSIKERMDFVAQYKLCTVGYDIGSNKITGWGTKYEYLAGFLWFKESKTYIENIINLLEAVSDVGTEIYDSYLQTLGDAENVLPGYNVSISWDADLGSIVSFGEEKIFGTDQSNIPNKLKSIIFEIDYDAMYNGAVKHSKDYIDDDDITTVDNCSAALTVLEADGLFEKEKMNRMSNKVFKIPARYDNQNGGATFDKVQKLATYDELTDSIIYSREYQIFDNVILANYESTREYILKNYFTSVWAKYRTYSYMSYGESIKRADNFRELLILSRQGNFYEKEELLVDETVFSKRNFLSFLVPSVVDNNIGKLINDNAINCGYYVFNEKKYLSDINSFSNGNSICFNICAYDNISGGNYVDKMSDNTIHLSLITDYDKANYRTTQLWYNTVGNESDAFVETVGIYFCHLDNNGFWKDGILSPEDVADNASKFLALPALLDPSAESYQSNIIGKQFVINKDNKEKLDTTFQFDYVSSISDKENILFSSWISKLNDMIGTYKKFEKNQLIRQKIQLSEAPSIFVYQENENNSDQSVVIKISENLLNQINSALTSEQSVSFFNGGLISCSPLNEAVKESGYILFYEADNSKPNQLVFNTINDLQNYDSLDNSTKITVSYNFIAPYYRSRKPSGDIFDWFLKTTYVNNSKYNLSLELSLSAVNNETVNNVSQNYYYFKGTIDRSVFYVDTVRIDAIQTINIYWNSNYRGNNDLTQLNENNSVTIDSYVNMTSSEYEETDETNMIVILSTNKTKPNLVYNSFKIDENNECELPEGMFFFTNGFNGVKNNQNITDLFVVANNYIAVKASLLNNYEQDIKSIQYYYKDVNGWLHFVFGVNIERNEKNGKYDDFNIYLSNVSKRNMKVYDDMHRYIGYARNYQEELAGQEYGTEQYYVLGKLKSPTIQCDSEAEEDFVITVYNSNPFPCYLSFTDIGLSLELPVGKTELIVNPTEPLEEGQIDVTEELGEVVENYLNEELAYDINALFVDQNANYTNSDEVNVFEANLELLSISIVSIPVTVYSVGDSLNLENAVITATYSDGTTANVVNECIINGYDMNRVGTQLVSVKYIFNGIAKTGSFLILVKPTYVADPVVNVIAIGENGFIFKVENRNDFAVTLRIVTSSTYYTQTINANTVANFDTRSNRELEEALQDSISAYLSPSGLEDSVDCYFERENITSDNVVILEANR